jgi:hypothetical protein
LRSDAFAQIARSTTTAFTRCRKLPLPQLVTFLLNLPRTGLQPELNAFLDHAVGDTTASLSKSAVCQARRGLNPDAMRDLLQHSGDAVTAHSEVPSWHGRRVLALDSSVLRVPNTPECAEYFGGMQCASGKFKPLARASVLFDVARDCVIDAFLGKFSDDDRSLAQSHWSQLTSNDLVVMDRGYPARTLLRQFTDKQVAYCARLTHQSWKVAREFIRSTEVDRCVDLGTATEPLPARLIRHVLPNGTQLVLVTNIMDQAIRPSDFAELYRRRWRIEEGFKTMKARLQVENWSGCLPHTVLQDFYATLTHANCAAIVALDARPDLIAADTVPEPDAKGWRYRLNRTLVNKSLRHKLPHLLLLDEITSLLDRILMRLRAPDAVERTKPGRSCPRKTDVVKVAGFHGGYAAA